MASVREQTMRRLSAKLAPTFADRGCHVASMTDPYDCILGFIDQSHYFFFQVAPQFYSNCTHNAEWTPFQTRYYSENLVVPGTEPEPLDL
jgi:hypothetical protein